MNIKRVIFQLPFSGLFIILRITEECVLENRVIQGGFFPRPSCAQVPPVSTWLLKLILGADPNSQSS